MARLIRNAAECVGCGKVLESKYGHDFRTHRCAVGWRVFDFFVDGGLGYSRRGWLSGRPEDHFIERSEYAE